MAVPRGAEEGVQHPIPNLKLLVFLKVGPVLLQKGIQQKGASNHLEIVFHQVRIAVRPADIDERPQAADEVRLLGRAIRIG